MLCTRLVFATPSGTGRLPAANRFPHTACLAFEQIQELGPKLLQASLALHQQVVNTFRRTAVNFHYE